MKEFWSIKLIATIIIGLVLIVISLRLPTGIAMAILLAYMIPATMAIYSQNNHGPTPVSSQAKPEPKEALNQRNPVHVR